MVMSVFGAWALAAIVCCWLMRRLRLPDVVQYAWAASDAGFLTLLLYVTPVEPGQFGAGPLLGRLSAVDRRRRAVFSRATRDVHDGRLPGLLRRAGGSSAANRSSARNTR